MELRDPQLSQAYQEALHPEPSPELDAPILTAARQAVARRPAHKRGFWFSWALPLSTAAVLVLGVSLLFEVQRQAPEYLEPGGAHTPAGPADTAGSSSQPAEPTLAQRGTRPAAAARQESLDSAQETGAPMAAAPQPFPAQANLAPSGPEAKTDAKAEAAQSRASGPTMHFSEEVSKAQALDATALEGPEQRVEMIRQLLREGRRDAARQAIDKLKQDYPGFALPADFKDL